MPTRANAPGGPDGTGPEDDLSVLHLVQPVEGGVARVVTDLVRDQLRSGFRVTVACPEGGPLSTELSRLGARMCPWPATRSPGPALLGETLRAARLIRQVRPDVIHAHSAKAGVAARLAARGTVPTVFQPHAWSFEAVGGITARLSRSWERAAVRWTSRVVCVSEGERATGERAGVLASFAVIPNGVDLDQYRAPDEKPAATDAPLVVCVGRLCRQKGQDVLLRAWQDVRRAVPGAHLVLVGDGPDLAALRAAAPASVSLVGAVSDTAAWYRAADLVVLPSRWEGMALAPLEAMACGTPVVVTDVGGSAESLAPGHAPLCLVPPEDPGALADAMTRLLTDAPLRASLARQGHDHVTTTHDVRQTARSIARVYRDVAALQRSEHREPISQ
ncbi:glycosyltransferase [Streptomyces sp. NBC_00083]|uniref:glycosyltransferase n=1 Tax=Streptomyces sp. NBC_00083 TaxID=2975647 RepID=UPI002258E9F1|nr:glycosyltransferase [Streptomyces sp. NBC_00083]MCX5381769.1 glycosyltransferase [Streptomyces sp. NBC_00083]